VPIINEETIKYKDPEHDDLEYKTVNPRTYEITPDTYYRIPDWGGEMIASFTVREDKMIKEKNSISLDILIGSVYLLSPVTWHSLSDIPDEMRQLPFVIHTVLFFIVFYILVFLYFMWIAFKTIKKW
jgi:hypothetical protein